MKLLARRHWVFDMDGTLTCSVHDFDALRDELGIPRGKGLLEHLAECDPEVAARINARIEAWELEHAERGRAEDDAVALIERLLDGGARIGVLTRNTRRCALRTLEVAGLSRYFDPICCIGRDDHAPKPSPAGIEHLLRHWGAERSDAVMVGDWVYDVQAGRAAGVATVLVDRDGSAERYRDQADAYVRSLADLR